MKKQDIVTAIQELVQDDSGPMQALVGRWVDFVLLDMSAKGCLPSLLKEEFTTLVQDQRDYALPDLDRVTKVFVPAWGHPQGILRKLSVDAFLVKMLEDGVTYSSRPQWYSIFANSILRLHPLPDATNAPASPTDNDKLHIYRVPTIATLASVDEIAEIKEKHIPTLLWGTYQYAVRFKTPSEIAEALEMYRAGIRDMTMDIYNDPELSRVTAYYDI